ncbi:MAG: hypothetical protein HPY52_16065 [Firmicutes bacterium]|nr:hypothetical protein [Bacillota bacterium]
MKVRMGACMVDIGLCVMGLAGGGTNTTCAVVNCNGEVLGYGRGGPANINFVEPEVATQSFRQAIGEAISSLKNTIGSTTEREHPSLAAVCVASPTPREICVNALDGLVSTDRLVFVGEAEAGLASCLVSTWGMVIIAGTGSFAWLKTEDGRTHAVGGWGTLIGDEGSAFWIGLEGLKAAVRGYDRRGEETVLTQVIPKYLGLTTIRLLTDELYRGKLQRRDRIAGIARVVAKEASKGDRVSIEIFRRAARELALAALACAKHLGAEAESFPCVLSGGVFESGDLILNPLRETLKDWLPGATIIPARAGQVVGACAIALREAGVDVDQILLEKLRAEIKNAAEGGIALSCSAKGRNSCGDRL